jgi:AbrB family looped-hinge helix DNA binding protein
MKTTIDNAGRLVIPKEIRKQAGLKPGMPLEVRIHEGCIEIEPAPIKVQLERKGRFVVAVPTDTVAPLTSATVEETRRKLRHERGSRD